MEAYWQLYALTTSALFLKLFAVAAVQGYYRLSSGTFVNPEDAAFFGKTLPAEREHPMVIRASNTLRNDLENIPIFLFLLLGTIQLQVAWWSLVGACVLFVLSRIGHTLCYLWPRQPLRNRMYLLGQGVMIVLIGLMLGAMFRS